MENLIYILLFIVGIVMGGVVSKMVSNPNKTKLEKDNIELIKEKERLGADKNNLSIQVEKLSEENKKLINENNVLRENLAKESASFEQQKNQIKLEEDIIELVKKEFSTIAAKQISKEQEGLIEKNQSAVKLSLDPLSNQLESFRKEINQYKTDYATNTETIKQKISDLEEKSFKLSETAQSLTDALTQNKNVKGWYGEDLARTILEKSGFQEGIHFCTQELGVTETDTEGNKIVKPDYEIFLPDKRNLVIDSKAILSSIVDLNEEGEEKEKKIFSAVKTRVKELSEKKYQNIKGLRQPEFVIMYIPVEPIVNLLYTTKDGMEIIDFSRKNNVVITGSVSLVTIINLIKWIWRENDRIKNLDEIVSTGTRLYDAVAKHAEELVKIQKSLSDVKDLTDVTLSRLVNSSSRINIFKEAEKLKSLGLSPSREIPNNLLND